MTLTLAPKTESRLLALAVRHNESPEAVLDMALETLWQDEAQPAEPAGLTAPDRKAHLRRLLLAATEEARLVEPEPEDSPSRAYYRNHPFAQGVAEKLGEQGLNID